MVQFNFLGYLGQRNTFIILWAMLWVVLFTWMLKMHVSERELGLHLVPN
jgi:hypothetical protein